MAKRTRIEPVLFQCTICKKKYFSYSEKEYCSDCDREKNEEFKALAIRAKA